MCIRDRAITVPGEMRLDTDIIIDLMNRMGYPQPHLTSAEIMDEIASVTPSFGGISHARLDSEEVGGKGLQWPCPTKDHPGTPIMHVGKFSRGLGWFYPAEYVPSAELPDEEYPIILMTGRILYHYTTRAMTGKTPELMEIAGHSFIEMNIVDADKLGIKNGDKVRDVYKRQIMPREGIFTKVLKGGVISEGDEINVVKRPMRAAVLTLSLIHILYFQSNEPQASVRWPAGSALSRPRDFRSGGRFLWKYGRCSRDRA